GLESGMEPLLAETDADTRGAAIGWLLAHGAGARERAQTLLEGPDPELRALALDVLLARPGLLPTIVTAPWVDRLIQTGVEADLWAAARSLGLLDHGAAEKRLRILLDHPLIEVRRAALLSAARRPSPGLLDPLIARLVEPELAQEGLQAVAALGQAAVPALAALTDGARGPLARARACDTLARIGNRSAIAALLRVARSDDPRARYDGLRALNRMRVRSASGLVKKSLAFRLWQRELDDLRANLLPAHILHGATDPRVALLASSFAESADRALDRSCRALACYYRPEPFRSVYRYLQNPGAPKATARSLEYLSQLIPRRRFGALRELFENPQPFEGTEAEPSDGQVAGCIETAYAMGDAWLRACAVRAAHALLGRIAIKFAAHPDEDDIVRAELAAYHAARSEEGVPA
ncbi:MAG: hypothetical protein ABI960_08765, partial [Candidatus Eisenbacteria bacterium]